MEALSNYAEYILWGIAAVLALIVVKKLLEKPAPRKVVVGNTDTTPAPAIYITTTELAKFNGKDSSLPLYVSIQVQINAKCPFSFSNLPNLLLNNNSNNNNNNYKLH